MPREDLAIHGGAPVRSTLLPYARQSIDEEDVRAVSEVLRGDWLTTGPKVQEFEKAFAAFAGSRFAVAVSNGTAALHAAYFAAGITQGDEVIVPAVTFAATANAAVFLGGVPRFADVNPETLLIDPASIEKLITPKTKAIVAVDYAGQPCDYDALRDIADRHRISLLADSCHALGGSYRGKPVGSLASLNAFSFHAVKPLAAGEGGMITTDDEEAARRMRLFRNHGITTEHRERQEKGSWFYEMTELGFNYRLTDIQCALGLSQLRKVGKWTARRQAIAETYGRSMKNLPLRPLAVRSEVSHAYHLYVIELDLKRLSADRSAIFAALRAEGIGVNVHYIPVHLHPYYREKFQCKAGQCPVAEAAYDRILSLPLFAAMTDGDVRDTIAAVEKVTAAYC